MEKLELDPQQYKIAMRFADLLNKLPTALALSLLIRAYAIWKEDVPLEERPLLDNLTIWQALRQGHPN